MHSPAEIFRQCLSLFLAQAACLGQEIRERTNLDSRKLEKLRRFRNT
jgi:hypothetical protein